MTDHVPDTHPTAAPPAPAAGTTAPAVPVATAAAPAALPAADNAAAPGATDSTPDAGSASASVPADAQAETGTQADTSRPAGSGKRRGGRNRRKSGGADAGQPQPQQSQAEPQADAATGAKAPRGPRPIPPALDKLAALYPQLFGAVFRPLKRGIFQDLVAAHPDDFEREALKVALGIHTRSTRYLQSVAAGQQRHDLQGQAVEAMAPEHIHQALVEVHRRRSGRGNSNASNHHSSEDLLPKLRARIVANIEASGLSREEYAERVRTRDEASNALLDEALAEMAAKTAREEALVRAFEASGKTVEAFADMYGMDPRNVVRSLHSAQARAAAAAAASAVAAQQEQEAQGSAAHAEADAEAGAGAEPTPEAAPAGVADAAGPAAEVAASSPAAPEVAAAPAALSPDAEAAASDADAAVDGDGDADARTKRRSWCLRAPMTMTPRRPEVR